MKKLAWILFFLLVPVSALAQVWTIAQAEQTLSCAGPGNVQPAAIVFWSVRSYAFPCSGRIMNVCEPTGVTCADFMGDGITGDLVWQTVGGVNCQTTSTCIVKTWYNQGTGGTTYDGLASGAASLWQVLKSNCTSAGKPCIVQDGNRDNIQAATNLTILQPFTMVTYTLSTNTGDLTLVSAGGANVYSQTNSGGSFCLAQTQGGSFGTVGSCNINNGIWQSTSVQFNAQYSLMIINGVPHTLNAVLDSTGTNGPPAAMLSFAGGSSGTLKGTGYITEMGIYPRLMDLSTNQATYFPFQPVPNQAYYVAAAGNDNNNGSSPAQAWQSLAKVQSAAFTQGNSILFNGGDSFTGCINFAWNTNIPSGGNSSNPITIGSYGTGKATLLSNCPSTTNATKSAHIIIDGVSGITVQNLILSANSTNTMYGILIQCSNSTCTSTSTAAQNIIIQNNETIGYTLGSLAGGSIGGAAHIFITGFTLGGTCGWVANVTVQNNVIHGTTVTSQDDTGVTGQSCGAGAPHTDLVNVNLIGNHVYNMGGVLGVNSGNGLLLNGVDGGTAKFNYVHDISGNGNTCGGGAGIWAYSSNNVNIQFNEVHHVHTLQTVTTSACDRSGLGFDGGVTNSVIEYNWSHDNDGAGTYTCAGCAGQGPWGPNTVRYNLFQNNGTQCAGTGGVYPTTCAEINFGNVNTNAYFYYVYNNTVYNSIGAPILGYNQGSFQGGLVANNIFIATGPSSNGFTTVWNNNNGNYPSAITQVNNVWYTPTANTLRFHTNVGGTDSFYSTLAAFQAATGFETGSVATNPLVAGAPATGNCASLTGPQPCPAGWTPGTGSPAIGTGLDLTMPPYSLTIGSQDYYGNSIPTPRWIGGVQ